MKNKFLAIMYVYISSIVLWTLYKNKFTEVGYYEKNASNGYLIYKNIYSYGWVTVYWNNVYSYKNFFKNKTFIDVNTPFWSVVFDWFVPIKWEASISWIENHLWGSLKDYAIYNVWIVSKSKKQRNEERRVSVNIKQNSTTN